MRIGAGVIALLSMLAVSACAGLPSLDDASSIDIRPASPTDLARFDDATQQYARHLFSGASFSDGKGHITASFSATQYDAFRAYLREHSGMNWLPGVLSRPQWPVMRLSFLSRRELFDPDSEIPHLAFYLCGAGDGKGGLFKLSDVMWHGRVVTPDLARDIETARKGGASPQDYEVFFEYVYWDETRPRQNGDPVTLLPLPNDLCAALHEFNMLVPPSLGRPLRIDRDAVNAAAGPLPREFTPAPDTSVR